MGVAVIAYQSLSHFRQKTFLISLGIEPGAATMISPFTRLDL